MKYFAGIRILPVVALLGLSGCEPEKESPEAVESLRVGIIAPLSGPGRSWGETTLRCARVIANYHNRNGGYEIGGERRRIELYAEDDQLAPELARASAKHLILEKDVHAVIGPLGDDAAVAAAPILNGYRVPYVHYGFDASLVADDSLGLLGMPLPQQTLPVLFEYLRDSDGYDRILVIAKDTKEAIQQKRTAERVATEQGFELLHLSKYDVSEETFDTEAAPSVHRDWARRLVALDPRVILLTGLSPGELPEVAALLERAGYSGTLAAQNSQDTRYLNRFGPGLEIFFVGGPFPVDERSDYYSQLRERYIAKFGEPSEEFDTKLYALEMLLLLFREAGAEALDSPAAVEPVLAEASFVDPFFTNGRKLRLVGEGAFEARRQISVPIVISRLKEGKLDVVHYGVLND